MLRSFSDWTYKFVTCASTVLFAVLILLIFAQVVLRYAFATSVIWGEELSKFVFVWLMFLGISSGIYNSKHLGIAYFAGKISPRGQLLVKYFCYGMTIVFFSILCWAGAMLSLANLDSLSPVLHVAYGLVYAIIPFSSLLCVLFSVTILTEVAGQS
jgi:TRAP-type C4-dicarboxylate transport system, small permease component